MYVLQLSQGDTLHQVGEGELYFQSTYWTLP